MELVKEGERKNRTINQANKNKWPEKDHCQGSRQSR